MIDELSNRGFNLIEFRGQMAISVNDKGEYFLSRKPHELKKRFLVLMLLLVLIQDKMEKLF